jgi:hypothetical protein
MSGIGNINNSAGVSYTEMTGLGLTGTAQDQVKLDVAVSSQMSDDILAALKEFRAEGNLHPTSAEMEAKLSVVGAVAKQNDINQVQHLISGFQAALTAQMSGGVGGGDPNNKTGVGYALAGVIAGGSSNISKYFGDAIGAKGDWAVWNMLGGFGIDHTSSAFNALAPSPLPNGSNSNAQISSIISQLQTKLATLQSQSAASSTGSSSLTAHQWLAKEMGVSSPHDSYSLQQWGEIAQQLQVNAAKKQSQLAIGAGGGIQQVNGQYFVNGQEMSLSQVNFCVRANQYQLIDQQIADQMEAIQRNNEKAKEAQNLLAAIKKAFEAKDLGQVQTSSVTAGDFFNPSASDGIIQTFMKAQFGDVPVSDANYENYNFVINGWNANSTLKGNLKEFFDLIKAASPTFYSAHINDNPSPSGGHTPLYTFSGTITNSDYSDLKTAISSYLSANSTDNQVAQQRLDALNNSRQAILDGMSAFTQGQSQVTDRIGGNL